MSLMNTLSDCYLFNLYMQLDKIKTEALKDSCINLDTRNESNFWSLLHVETIINYDKMGLETKHVFKGFTIHFMSRSRQVSLGL